MLNTVLNTALRQILITSEMIPGGKSLHHRIGRWATECLGENQVASKPERAYRFFEESVELSRSAGLSKKDALAMVEAEYAKPEPGVLYEEVGDVGIALNVLCIPYRIDPMKAIEDKLADVIPRSQKIRAKQSQKRFRDPLV